MCVTIEGAEAVPVLNTNNNNMLRLIIPESVVDIVNAIVTLMARELLAMANCVDVHTILLVFSKFQIV